MNSEKTTHTSPLRASYGASFPGSLEKRFREKSRVGCTNVTHYYTPSSPKHRISAVITRSGWGLSGVVGWSWVGVVVGVGWACNRSRQLGRRSLMGEMRRCRSFSFTIVDKINFHDESLSTVDPPNNTIYHNTIWHITWHLEVHDINQTMVSRKTLYTTPSRASYGLFCGWVFGRKKYRDIKGFDCTMTRSRYTEVKYNTILYTFVPRNRWPRDTAEYRYNAVRYSSMLDTLLQQL